ncbi:MAG: hypothetical protein H8K07_03650 [Nitrospira sp.]|nr:hypothetical protein [Nitrospira sp.]
MAKSDGDVTGASKVTGPTKTVSGGLGGEAYRIAALDILGQIAKRRTAKAA